LHLIRKICYIILLLLSSKKAASFGVFDLISKDAQQSQNDGGDNIDIDDNVQDFFQDYKLDIDSVMRGSAKIIAINKITAQRQLLNVKINTPVFFYNLEIILRKCLKINDPYKPDDYGLFTLTEYKLNDDASITFQGWLISSSISLSNFGHPVYEIFLKDCL
jgi:hypothetical protein